MGFGDFLKKAGGLIAPFNPLIGAGASLLGGTLANRASKASSARQMAFQSDMSGTAHQREMMDLEKAGLNPILTGKYGGSSTPTGSQYKPQDVVSPAVTTALSYKRLNQEILNMKATEKKIKTETKVLGDTKGGGTGRTFEYFGDKIESMIQTMKNNMVKGKSSAGSKYLDDIEEGIRKRIRKWNLKGNKDLKKRNKRPMIHFNVDKKGRKRSWW